MNPAQSPDLTLLLPSSQRPRDEMIAELRARIEALRQPWQKLVAHILLDEEFLPRFASAPAARSMHHAYVGGLLEHSLSMAAIAEHLAGQYDYVNKDLLMAGVLLHDMGKTLEYDISGTFTRSEDGRLVGHITRAAILIEMAAAQLRFPAAQLRDLTHLIVSHHGTNEWGSPATPRTLEGILLHQIDLLDSRVQGFFDHVRDDAGHGPWTMKRNPMFGSTMRYPEGWGMSGE
jgi:3'-5' exoribonuclease